MADPTHQPAITHPIHSGRVGLLWWLASKTIFLLTTVVLLVGMAIFIEVALPRQSDIVTALLLCGFVAVLLGLRVIQNYVHRQAWGEVPGAHAIRSLARGDMLAPRPVHAADYAWRLADAGLMIAGAALLTRLEPPVGAWIVAASGAYLLGGVTGILVRERNRPDFLHLVAAIAWIVIGKSAIPYPTTEFVLAMALMLCLGVIPGYCIALFESRRRGWNFLESATN